MSNHPSMMTSPKPIEYGYSVLRINLKDDGSRVVPIGVVAWQSTDAWHGSRWLSQDETLTGITNARRTLMEIARDQVDDWVATRHVPYHDAPLDPSSDKFWAAASRILCPAVTLDPPRAMTPMIRPDEDMESLYEAVVQPRQSSRRVRTQINGAISRALGSALAKRMRVQMRVPAFGGVKEEVRRGVMTEHGMVLIDGVNLSKKDARRDADALASRLMRIKAANKKVEMIVGYTASRDGLNGEADMRDWLMEKVTDMVFDLTAEDGAFRAASAKAVARAEGRLDRFVLSR